MADLSGNKDLSQGFSTVAPMCHKFLPHFELFFTLGVLFFKKQVFFKKLAT